MKRYAGLFLLSVAILTGGCALPQTFEQRVFERDGVSAIHASRYAGDPENPIDDLWIDVRVASPFEIRLPDGEWVAPQKMTAATLARHGFELTVIGGRDYAFWHPPFSAGALAGRHLALRFDLDANGRATAVALNACGWALDAALRTPDGRHVFGFPIAVADLETLFGATSVSPRRTRLAVSLRCRRPAASDAAATPRSCCRAASAAVRAHPSGTRKGSCPLSRADWIRLMIAAARWPARRLPANSQFLRPSAIGRI